MSVKMASVLMLMISVVVIGGCSVEEKTEEMWAEELRGVVSELTNARLDNRSIEEVGKVFKKYKNRIGSDVWDNFFNIEMSVVQNELMIAEEYGGVPRLGEVKLMNYGKDGESGSRYFTVVSEMKTVSEEGIPWGVIDIYMLYEFGGNGKLIDFTMGYQPKEPI